MTHSTQTTAILLIAHGSRREEANEDLRQMARAVGRRTALPIVETAYLEISEPTIPQAAHRCVTRGANRVLLVPYFLSPGAHVAVDLEEHCRTLAGQLPQAQFVLCAPLGGHRLLVDVVLDRIAEAEGRHD